MSFMIPLELCGAHCFRNDRNTHPRGEFFVRSVQKLSKLWYLRICSLHSPAAKWFVSETSLTRDNSESKKLELPLQMSSPYHGTSFLFDDADLDLLGHTWSLIKVKDQKSSCAGICHLSESSILFFTKLNIDLMGTYGYIMVIYLTWFKPFTLTQALHRASMIHSTPASKRHPLNCLGSAATGCDWGSLLHILQTNYIKHTWHDIKHIIEIQSWCT